MHMIITMHQILKNLSLTILLLLSLVIGVSNSTTVLADGHQRSREEAIKIAKQRSGNGRVLGVKKQIDKNGVSVYAVKIITNGRVKVYSIPVSTN